MNQKQLQEHNHHLRNELRYVANRNHVLHEQNEILRLKNNMLWRLVLDLREYIEGLEDER